MKRKFVVLITLLVCSWALFSQQNTEFFVFKYKPGLNTGNTTLALGTNAQKFDIQYKKLSDTNWIVNTPASGTMTTISIPYSSAASDVYEIRFRFSNTSTPSKATIDFAENSAKLIDITQWGSNTGALNFDFGLKNNNDPQKYSNLVNVSAQDTVSFSLISFKHNAVFSGVNTNMRKWGLATNNVQNCFQNAVNFNGNISNWNVSAVTKFSSMFNNASLFNQDISSWDVSKAETFINMFIGASSFNQDISQWDVSAATNFQSMFNKASSFDQNLGAWTVSNASTMKSIFNNSGMSTQNYDNTLNGWWSKKDQLPDGIEVGAQNLKYSTSTRQEFIDKKNWIFVGDEIDPLSTLNDPVIQVSFNKKQKIRLGVDAERLWHWNSTLKNELADVAVGELKSDFVRVAINCAYEREEGHKNESAYNEIIEMMTAIKNVNPDINFFASPRPLHEAYTRQEKENSFGHRDNTPWSPYPLWILHWAANGTKTLNDGTVVPNYERGYFDYVKLTQYFADYLNFMHSKGLNIRFLDMSNEQQVVTPAITKYMYDNLPGKLNPGVQMPGLIAPSTWGVQQGIDWLATVNAANNEHTAFEVASVHNTGGGIAALEEFATNTHALDKEAWNTEMHNWVGLNLHDDVINSDIFWHHMRAGFNGIDAWLFYSAVQREHRVVMVYPDRVERTGKYEIFKAVVNNFNRGNYVDISMPSTLVPTAAFTKDNLFAVWILNKHDSQVSNTTIRFAPEIDLINQDITVTRWNGATTSIEGAKSVIKATKPNEIQLDLDAETLYCFQFEIDTITSVKGTVKDDVDLNVFTHDGNLYIDYKHHNNNHPIFWQIYNAQGQAINHGRTDVGAQAVRINNLSAGVYFVRVLIDDRLFVRKVLVE